MTPTVRFRVDFGEHCSIGVGKIELLEGVAATGSLSSAARQMSMSYRRAWLLLEDMNNSFDSPVARASVGGKGGGGVKLTPFGERLIVAYRKLEAGLQPIADNQLKEFARHVKGGNLKNSIKPSGRALPGRTTAGRPSRRGNAAF
jgi:molybdate transport system regulatory protein